jgi:hypothetical protein
MLSLASNLSLPRSMSQFTVVECRPTHWVISARSSASLPSTKLTSHLSWTQAMDIADRPALGYLVGPTIGSLLYSATHPSLSRGSPSPLEVMDKAFYDHIKANRASPAFQSVNNPAPDFYGEKVCPCIHYTSLQRRH